MRDDAHSVIHVSDSTLTSLYNGLTLGGTDKKEENRSGIVTETVLGGLGGRPSVTGLARSTLRLVIIAFVCVLLLFILEETIPDLWMESRRNGNSSPKHCLGNTMEDFLPQC